MTNEELQGKIEFIIGHQARFSSDLDRVKDLITQLAVAGRDRFADHTTARLPPWWIRKSNRKSACLNRKNAWRR
jgi:hypothetical protein